jgi:molybdate transport system substrate-binding protein
MGLSRRRIFAVAPAAVLATALAPRAGFGATTTDLAVSCDTAAAPAVIAAAKVYRSKTDVRVRVFPTAPGLLLPQIEREIQNDIIFTRISVIDAAERQGLLAPGSRTKSWRNRLVTAAAKEPAGPEGSFAVPDPSPGSDIDGIAILQRLGAPPALVIGVIDTESVARALTDGSARRGLLHATEIAADDRLQAIAPVPDEIWPPILYAAVVTKLARRGDPAAFLAFLGSPNGQTALRAAGLEVVA